MGSRGIQISPAGDSALLLELPSADGASLRALSEGIRQGLGDKPGIDVVAGFDSLLIRYDPTALTDSDVRDVVADLDVSNAAAVPRHFEIPVAYGSDLGPDLESLGEMHGLQPDDVIRLHSAAVYTVRCIGFTPGFPYLEGLDAALVAPRLATPRRLVPAGSVAIAGDQAGIYPSATPGGWRIIGRTPVVLFDPGRRPPVPYSIGDVISFVPISGDNLESIDAHLLFHDSGHAS